MRKSDLYLSLEGMSFAAPLIESALRVYPDNLEAAVEYILMQTPDEQARAATKENYHTAASFVTPSESGRAGKRRCRSARSRGQAQRSSGQTCDLFDDLSQLGDAAPPQATSHPPHASFVLQPRQPNRPYLRKSLRCAASAENACVMTSHAASPDLKQTSSASPLRSTASSEIRRRGRKRSQAEVPHPTSTRDSTAQDGSVVDHSARPSDPHGRALHGEGVPRSEPLASRTQAHARAVRGMEGNWEKQTQVNHTDASCKAKQDAVASNPQADDVRISHTADQKEADFGSAPAEAMQQVQPCKMVKSGEQLGLVSMQQATEEANTDPPPLRTPENYCGGNGEATEEPDFEYFLSQVIEGRAPCQGVQQAGTSTFRSSISSSRIPLETESNQRRLSGPAQLTESPASRSMVGRMHQPAFQISAPGTTSSFQTGRGRQLQVSEAALIRAERLLQLQGRGPEAVLSPSPRRGEGSETSRSGPPPVPLHVNGVAVAAAQNPVSTVPAEIQSGMGRRLTVTGDVVEKISRILQQTASDAVTRSHEHSESSCRSIGTLRDRPISTGTDAMQSAGLSPSPAYVPTLAGPLPSSLATGGGRSVMISKVAMHHANQFLQRPMIDPASPVPYQAPALPFYNVGHDQTGTLSEEGLAKANGVRRSPALQGAASTICMPMNVPPDIRAKLTSSAQSATTPATATLTTTAVCGEGVKTDSHARNQAGPMDRLEAVSAPVGFQTGRGRRVNVSEESVAKASHLFDFGSKSSLEPEGVRGYAEDHNSNSREQSSAFAFHSGRGHRVEISHESLQKVSHLFASSRPQAEAASTRIRTSQSGPQNVPQDVNRRAPEIKFTPAQESFGFQTDRCQQVAVWDDKMREVVADNTRVEAMANQGEMERKLVRIQHLDAEILKNTRQDTSMRKSTLGLEMGRGQQVPATEPAVQKDQPFGADYSRSKTSLAQCQGHQMAVEALHTHPGDPVAIRSDAYARHSPYGFETGRGQHIRVSAEAMQKIDHLFTDDDSRGGATTAQDQENQNSLGSLSIAGGMMASRQASRQQQSSVGFETGRGRQVKVSEEAMQKVARFLAADESRDEAAAAGGQGYQEMVQNFPNDARGLISPQHDTRARQWSFGFETGGGQEGKVSAEAMQETSHLFANTQGAAASIGRGGLEAMQKKNMEDARPVAITDSRSHSQCPSSFFQTGRGRQVEVSDNAMHSIQHLFQASHVPAEAAQAHADESRMRSGDHKADAFHLAGTPKGIDGGLRLPFPVASQRQQRAESTGFIQEDSQHLAEVGLAKKAFEKLPSGDSEAQAVCPADLFQTGRGRQVNVSEQAMRRVNHLFTVEAIQRDTTPKPECNVATSSIGADAAAEQVKACPEPLRIAPTSIDSQTPQLAGMRACESAGNMPSVKQNDSPDSDPFEQAGETNMCQSTPAAAEDGERAPSYGESHMIGGPAAHGDMRDLAQRARTEGQGGRLSLRQLGSTIKHHQKGHLMANGLRLSTLDITRENVHFVNFDAQDLPILTTSDEDGAEPASKQMPAPQLLQTFKEAISRISPSRKPPSNKWFANHFCWIVWKLASFERSFPGQLGGRYFNKGRVMQQIHYRYRREVLVGARSAVRLILNGDAPASLMMVLCVSRIYPCPHVPATNSPDENKPQNPSGFLRVELTDGWYAMDAQLDVGLSNQAKKGRLAVGSKLMICNAQLQSLKDGGIEPLEICTDDIESRPFLQLAINSTRLAAWHTRLGFQRRRTMPVPVRSLVPGGGQVSCLEVVVLRRYSVMYAERLKGRRLSRILTEAEEDAAQQAHEALCQARMEKLVDETMRELASSEEWTTMGLPQNTEALQDFRGSLQPLKSQRGEVGTEKLDTFREWQRAQVEARMADVRKEVLSDAAYQRSSGSFFRVKVCSVRSATSSVQGPSNADQALVTLWESNGDFDSLLHEGNHVQLFGLNASTLGNRLPGSSLPRLNASGSCRVRAIANPARPAILASVDYRPRQLISTIRDAQMVMQGGALGKTGPQDFDCVCIHLASIIWELPERQLSAAEGKDEERDRKPTLTRLFFADPSGCILCVEHRHYGSDGPPAALRKGKEHEVWALYDLTFQSYDPKTDTMLARYSTYSTVRRSTSHMQGLRDTRDAVLDLQTWSTSQDGQSVLMQEQKRLLCLADGTIGNEPSRPLGGIQPHSAYRQMICGWLVGTCHADDSLYLLLRVGQRTVPAICRSQYTVRKLVQLLLRFASQGAQKSVGSAPENRHGLAREGICRGQSEAHCTTIDIELLDLAERRFSWAKPIHFDRVARALRQTCEYWDLVSLRLTVQQIAASNVRKAKVEVGCMEGNVYSSDLLPEYSVLGCECPIAQ